MYVVNFFPWGLFELVTVPSLRRLGAVQIELGAIIRVACTNDPTCRWIVRVYWLEAGCTRRTRVTR